MRKEVAMGKKIQKRTKSSEGFSKRGGYESGSKLVTQLDPPPRGVGAGVKPNSSGSAKK